MIFIIKIIYIQVVSNKNLPLVLLGWIKYMLDFFVVTVQSIVPLAMWRWKKRGKCLFLHTLVFRIHRNYNWYKEFYPLSYCVALLESKREVLIKVSLLTHYLQKSIWKVNHFTDLQFKFFHKWQEKKWIWHFSRKTISKILLIW